MTEAEELRATAFRHRRMMTTIDNKHARDVLEKLAQKCEDKAVRLDEASGDHSKGGMPADG